MFYTVYKVTNKENGKYYIGKHQTEDLDDGYMGSGNLIRRAIREHGRENFVKEILHVFETEEEMDAKEAELVVVSEETYNLCAGGKGGWGYVNKRNFELREKGIIVPNWTSEHARRISGWKNFHQSPLGKIAQQKGGKKTKELQLGWFNPLRKNGFLGKHHTTETKIRIGLKNKNKKPWNKGKPRSEETKQKISATLLKKKSLPSSTS